MTYPANSLVEAGIINPHNKEAPHICDNHINLLKEWANFWQEYKRPECVHVLEPSYIQKSLADSINWPNKTVYKTFNHCFDLYTRSGGGDYLFETVAKSIAKSENLEYFSNLSRNKFHTISNSVHDFMYAYKTISFKYIDNWEHIDHEENEYPFQMAVDLLKEGLVPSFDGELWRLHSGQEMDILREGELSGN